MESRTRKGLAENHTSDLFQGFVVLEPLVGKLPAFQFYVRDWLSDPQLRMCSHTTKGIWIDLLCLMWEAPERGKIEGTIDQLAHMVGSSNGDFEQFLKDAESTKFATVTLCSKNVTIINRRMAREEKQRSNTRLRVARFRSNALCNDGVTPPSSSSSSSSCTKVHKNTSSSDDDGLFDAFWKNYPKKVGRKAAQKAWKKIKNPKDVIEQLKIILPLQKKSDQWTRDNGQYIPHPATYLNQGRWEDEPNGDPASNGEHDNLFLRTLREEREQKSGRCLDGGSKPIQGCGDNKGRS